MYSLLFLLKKDYFKDFAQMNDVVIAKLPDEKMITNMFLTKLVMTQMLHGLYCTFNPKNVCMQDRNARHGRKCEASYLQ